MTRYPVNLTIATTVTDPRDRGIYHDGLCYTAEEAVAIDRANMSEDDGEARTAELNEVFMRGGYRTQAMAETAFERELAEGWARVEKRSDGWAVVGQTWEVSITSSARAA